MKKIYNTSFGHIEVDNGKIALVINTQLMFPPINEANLKQLQALHNIDGIKEVAEAMTQEVFSPSFVNGATSDQYRSQLEKDVKSAFVQILRENINE